MAPRYALTVLQEHLLIRRGESNAEIPEWELAESVRTMRALLDHLDAAQARYNETLKQVQRRDAA